MLEYEINLTDKTVAHKERFGQTDARIEIQVGHGHGVLEHVPETLLGIEQKQIGAQRECTLGETLRDGNLKLYISVGLGYMLADGTSEDKIIVLVKTEIRPRVKGPAYAVGIDRGFRLGVDYLSHSARGRQHGQRYREQKQTGDEIHCCE